MSSPPSAGWSKTAIVSVVLALVGWAGAVGAGVVFLERYAHQPGESGVGGLVWPLDSRLKPAGGDRASLVVALHPECPCSRATVEEVNRLLAGRPHALRVYALFVGDQAEAEASELWRSLRRIPEVELVADADGTETHRFDFRTSGEVRLFGPDRALWFHGGITIARGHAGANPGAEAIVAALRSRTGTSVATPVFGCALFGPETTPASR